MKIKWMILLIFLGDASELNNVSEQNNNTWFSHPFGIDVYDIMPLDILSKEN
jgi:hypothetical protein